MKGIDVSLYQGDINWKSVKKSGINFAMIKTSQGGSIVNNILSPFRDRYFAQNIINAYENNIHCGTYHYLMGTTIEDVKKETKFYLEQLKPHTDKIKFPCAVDMEDTRYKLLSKNENSKLIRTFCDMVAEAGFIPMLYTNRDFSTYYIDMNNLKDIDIWFALYRTPRSNDNKPEDFANITIWQWNEKGNIDGINAITNLDEGYFDYSDMHDEFKKGDIVEINMDAETYYNGGAYIPSWVKENYDHIITATRYKGSEVYKNGDKCVLLGEKIDKIHKKVSAGINTWTAIKNIKRI
ncbi:hypothetical protein LJB90_04115 [Eubacteriales bacterium OttesenSCG-928-G02]|nr:hypothetical protein [Eubacteriales bacterium OttesenSCG-928-G02]